MAPDQKQKTEEKQTIPEKGSLWQFIRMVRIFTLMKRKGRGLPNFFMLLMRWLKWVPAHPLGVVGFFVVYYILLNTINFFNWGHSSDQASANMVDAIISPFYGGSTRIGQDNIIVVTIDQKALRLLNNPYWPLNYDNQIKIINRIAKFKPKAIFLDFYYNQVQPEYRNSPKEITEEERLLLSLGIEQEDQGFSVETPENIQNFVRQLTILRNGRSSGDQQGSKTAPLPVFLGPVGNDIWLKGLREFVSAPFYGESASVGLEIDMGTTINYPLRDRAGHKSAAFVLFEIFCNSTRSEATQRCGDFSPFGQADRDLSLEWGLGQAPYQHPGLQIRATNQNSGLYSSCVADNMFDRIMYFGRLVRYAVFLGLYDKQTLKDRRCIYHHTLSVSTLFSASNTDEQALSDEEMSALFKDKIILIGADIDYLADRIDTPVSGTIPGVYAHAMALDNLIEYGKNVSQPPKKLFGPVTTATLVNICVVVLLCGFCVMVRMGKIPLGTTDKKRRRQKMRYYYISAFLILLAGSWFGTFIIMDWPVYNFFQIILLFVSLIFILEQFHFDMDKTTGETAAETTDNNQPSGEKNE